MPEPKAVSLIVAANFECLPRCTEFAAAQARQAGFPAARVRDIELVVEEVVSNICRHGYRDRSGTVELRCRRLEGFQLELEFVDHGPPFDMLALPSPDLSVDVEQRDVGGLGVPVVRALTDQASYRRDGERNIVRLVVHAERRSAGAPSS